MAGLGALRELDLDHLDLGIGGLGGEPLGREAAILVAAAEIAAADLPDDVAAELLVIAADSRPRRCRGRSRRASRPLFKARMALALSAPKLMAETLNSEIE